MSIIRESYEDAPGAWCDIDRSRRSMALGGKPVCFSETHVGLVLAEGEENMPDDSDWYAIVWSVERQCLETVYYMTTRFGGSDHNSCTIDATDEVRAAADAYLVAWALVEITAADRRSAKHVTKGRRVRVERGRKVPKGTEGLVIYERERTFGYHRTSIQIGIATSDVKIQGERGEMYRDVVWTYEHNCEVLNPEQYHASDEDLAQLAQRARGCYRIQKMQTSAAAGMLVAGR